MEKLVPTGKVKAIGVANYSLPYLKELLPEATITPAVNQIENHPCLPQQAIVDFCKSKGIHVTAYSPFGSVGSPLMTVDPVVEVAKRLSVPPAIVLLSYHSKSIGPEYISLILLTNLVARGSSVLAKSVNPDRIKANMALVKLDDSDMKLLNDYAADLEATGKVTRYVYPGFGVAFGFPDKP
jgi:diketogulonate reductase-like aldo/keto reductase